MQLQLKKIEDMIQEHQSTQVEIVAALKDYRSNQEQIQKEMFTVLYKLENQAVLNRSDAHNRQQELPTALHKLDSDDDKVHNISQQIMNVLPQPKLTVDGFSCKNVPSKVSGTYLIRVKNDSEPFEVYCEQKSFGGGWIVFQYRYNGSLDFYRGWNEFRDGFGDVYDEFWLGLEKVHQITSGRKHEFVVQLKDFNETYKYARYDAFEIGSESEQYVLKEFGNYRGTADDAIYFYDKGMKFSTKDRDNDENSDRHCAQEREGAWWHWDCAAANLNGRYMNAHDTKSMFWFSFREFQGLSYSRMMIRELE
ncbi:angiopoietin-4-like [Anopheles aquasalis]|uniref:angiopoietin-4-like n=1 Tax=Anopheles aquasalis TaxID=42839 RepID=UPI00215AEEE2|nr:angiopoietin-4-like [Anopheles aquasalis]